MKITGAIFATLIVFTFSAEHARAHQPNFTGSDTMIEIPDGNVSRAYYGELTGQPAVYSLTLTDATVVYLNILSPDIPGSRKDLVAIMRDSDQSVVATLNDPPVAWDRWYEEFAGDTYWKGPEFKNALPAGSYTITITNSDNTGKYVLAPGEAEVFTLAGTPTVLKELYFVKTDFFQKSPLSMFEGIIGKTLLVIALVIITFVLWLCKRLLIDRARK